MTITARLDASASELVGRDTDVLVLDKDGQPVGEFLMLNLCDQAFLLGRKDVARNNQQE